jgi:hypothetical protein
MKKQLLFFAFAFVATFNFAQITYSTDPWGNTVEKDSNGNTQFTYSKEIENVGLKSLSNPI